MGCVEGGATLRGGGNRYTPSLLHLEVCVCVVCVYGVCVSVCGCAIIYLSNFVFLMCVHVCECVHLQWAGLG